MTDVGPEARGNTSALAGVIPPRAAPGPAAPPPSHGQDWELTVNAGGLLDVLRPPALDVARVAALASALGGVGYVTYGLHLRLPAPGGSDPHNRRAPSPGSLQASLEPLERAQAELIAGCASILASTPRAQWGSGRARYERRTADWCFRRGARPRC